MAGKRSSAAKTARRKAYSVRREKKTFAQVRQIDVAARVQGTTDRHPVDYVTNSSNLYNYALQLPPVYPTYQDGTGIGAVLPKWSSSSMKKLLKHRNPITRVMVKTIKDYGLEHIVGRLDKQLPQAHPFDSSAAAKVFEDAAITCRQALCNLLSVSNSTAASGADYFADLYVELLKRSRDPDSTLQELLLDPRGFPAGILRNIPESGIFPRYSPNESRIFSREPSSLAKRFQRHYISAEVAQDRLFTSTVSEIRQQRMQQEFSEEGLTFVRCAILAKKGAPPNANLLDPEVSVRVVEDYSANGINRLSVEHHFLRESPVLPTLSDYQHILRLIASHSAATNTSWGVAGIDYKSAFRNVLLDKEEAKYLAIKPPTAGFHLDYGLVLISGLE
ncbi:hypothetical protein FOL47_000221 [Perkinsus chesapeaki]|uniref:Uncharacterized protein n=1 Tax=Perkinsus chesapeaki TaxID=330153 RepID=A0A7J6KXU5_PERCH|nr:hypothetical protein FOL47_000221 [Perkinsus chesapeaki]